MRTAWRHKEPTNEETQVFRFSVDTDSKSLRRHAVPISKHEYKKLVNRDDTVYTYGTRMWRNCDSDDGGGMMCGRSVLQGTLSVIPLFD